MKTYDSIIIGGGILGLASGYELAKLGQKVLIIEKGYLASGSTGRCIGGIRQQFSTKGAIKLAMENVRIFKQMREEFRESIDWYQGGYLLLAHSEEKKKDYLNLIRIQRELGLKVEFIPIKEVLKLVPLLNPDGLLGAAYCPQDGQANPFLVIRGYAEEIKRFGSKILTHTKVVKISTNGNKVVSLLTDEGDKYFSPLIINAAGPWAKEIGELAGIELELEPECHEALVTEGIDQLFDPMVVDYRPRGCYFQQLFATGQIIGCYTPENPIKGTQSSSSFNFLKEMPKRLLNLMPRLSELKVFRQWTGWYTMTPDGNPVIGETKIKGFWVIGGASGHGFMFGPTLGKCLAELIIKGKSSLPLDEFLLDRKYKKKEALK
ncbi:FAD-binding oxidoreductase [candidate division WOR-3 bacterium]|nr:FAD-binding oxidoreductase [candidate division WOR-3 bacterium]